MSQKRDLIVLVADADAESALSALLEKRQASLGIRRVTFDIRRHFHHDPGCCQQAVPLLRPYLNSHRHALVVFDRHGCGRDGDSRETIELGVVASLSEFGWQDRSEAIVIDPELEAWVWSDSPEVARTIGWGVRDPDLQCFLENRGFLRPSQIKPTDPRAAYEAALRSVGKRIEARRFGQLAQVIGLNRCQDPAFAKLKRVLRKWFPSTSRGNRNEPPSP